MKYRDLLEKNNSSENILNNMNDGSLPISPKFFDELFGAKNEIYFHSLSIKSIDKLIKLQGSKKTISAYTEWKGDIVDTIAWGPSGGEFTNPVIAILKGNYALHLNTDMWSFIGKDGRRWIDRYDVKEQGEESTDLMAEICDDLYDYNYNELQDISDKKEKIKLYFDKAYELLTKNKKEIIYAAKTDIGEQGYNELLAHSFKIQKFINFDSDGLTSEELMAKYKGYAFIDVPEDKLNSYMNNI